jgi:hypothetical protein
MNTSEIKNHITRKAVILIEKNKRQNFSAFLCQSLSDIEITYYNGEIENKEYYSTVFFLKQLFEIANTLRHIEPSGLQIRNYIEKSYNLTLVEINKKQFSQLKFNVV